MVTTTTVTAAASLPTVAKSPGVLRKGAALCLVVGGLAMVASNTLFRNPVIADSALLAAIGSDNAIGMAQAARNAYAAGRPAQAREAALAALRTAPLDSSSLAITILTEPDEAHATRQVQVLAALGWRADIAQVLIAQIALQSGEADIYRQRLNALLRRQSSDAITNALLDDGLADPVMKPSAIAALASASAGSQIWANERRSASALRNLAAALETLPHDDGDDDRKNAVMLVDRMQGKGLYTEAYDLWHRLYGPPRSLAEALNQPRIERYGWVLPDDQPITVSVDQQGTVVFEKGQPFAATVIATALRPVARSVHLNIIYGSGSDRLAWQFRCTGRAPIPTPVEVGDQTLTTPDRCEAPRLEGRMNSQTNHVAIEHLRVDN